MEEKAENPRDSAEPKRETNVWPREGTQEARVAARESRLLGGTEKDCRKAAPKEEQGGNLVNQSAEGSSAGASELTFRSVAEQCGKQQAEVEAISYPEEGNEACFQIEDQSFWFRHRNDCIRELVRNFPPWGKGPIFDVGGGNGFVAKGLMDAGWEVVLVEPGPSGARNAKTRGVKNVICGTTHSAGFKNSTLPAIGVFDVVEHIEDDLGFLLHLRNLLKPSGMLYLTVPAYNFLWSHEDVNAGHFRRYRLERGAGGMVRGAGEENRVGKNEPDVGIMQKLSHAGFKPVYGTYIFGFLPLPVFLFRTLPYRLGLARAGRADKEVRRDHSQKQGLLGAMMARSFELELKRIRVGETIRFGGSCLIAARK